MGAWKSQGVAGLVELLSKGAERRARGHEREIRDLHAKIGDLIDRRAAFSLAGPVAERGQKASPGQATKFDDEDMEGQSWSGV